MRTNHLILCRPLLLLPSVFPIIQGVSSFPTSQFFASGGQSIGASASVSVLSISLSNALAGIFFTASGTWELYIYMTLRKTASWWELAS